MDCLREIEACIHLVHSVKTGTISGFDRLFRFFLRMVANEKYLYFFFGNSLVIAGAMAGFQLLS